MLSKEIEKLEGSEASTLYYRLWIEQLADYNEKYSLSLLQKHLTSLSSSSKIKKYFLALRGLIHLELDEISSCQHIAKIVLNDLSNPYCLEFYQRYQFRFTADQKEILFLLMTKSPIVDYFHWQYLARSLLVKNKFHLLTKCLKYVKKSYLNSPLALDFEFMRTLITMIFLKQKKLLKNYLKNLEVIYIINFSMLMLFLVTMSKKVK